MPEESTVSGPADRARQSDSGERKRKLERVIRLTTETAKAKGWLAIVASKDRKLFKYATIAVSRKIPGTYDEVSGTVELTCNGTVKISCCSTSFHKWGLDDLFKAIKEEITKLPWLALPASLGDNEEKQVRNLVLLERVLRRFHHATRQLKHRHDNRSPLTINDEYDVQDLLHVILRSLFDDIRPEEYTPSYAGKASRMDFLLKSEQIVIEVKLASSNLRDRQVGEQLMLDIMRYQSHPECKRLVCFVYDPDGHIQNAAGLETDLSASKSDILVKVIVVSA